MHEIRLIVIQM